MIQLFRTLLKKLYYLFRNLTIYGIIFHFKIFNDFDNNNSLDFNPLPVAQLIMH